MQLFSKLNKMKMTDDVSEKAYYVRYTACFIIMSLLVYMVFIYNGKSFVACDLNRGGDGLVQHYNSFVYYGRYLRQIIKTLLFEHRLEIPMWDMSIGYGQDIITTLSYYVIGDPFSALSVFIPTKYTEVAYSLLIVLRLYCAGAAFSAYCRYKKHKSYIPIIGSMIYVFSYYGLRASILHPYFTLPMIYLPLLLIGVEKMLSEKKSLYYTGMIGLAAISNFYFFFMLCIVIVIYTIFRYIEIKKTIRIREVVCWIVRFAVYSLLGILMASVLFVPSVISILTASRVSVENYVPLLYDWTYYLKLIPTFMNGGFGNYYTCMGYTAIGLVAVVILVLKRKEKGEYKFLMVAFFIFMSFLMFPFAGHVFNGVGYVTNRWVWTLSMLVSYIVIMMIPEFKNISKKGWKIICTVVVLDTICVLGIEFLRTEKNILTILELLIVVLVIYYLSNNSHTVSVEFACMIMVGGMLTINAYYDYSPIEEGNYVAKFMDCGMAYDSLLKESPQYILKELDDNTIYRFDTAAISTGNVKRNSAMLLDMNGVAYYFSSTNDTITKFNTDMYMNYSMDQSYDNLDRRSLLQNLFGVKYVIVPNGKEQYRPYGYDVEVMNKNGNIVYMSENVFPIGFTSDSYITSSEYEMMDVIEKQEALLQTVVIENEIEGLKKHICTNTGEEIDYNVVAKKGIEWEDGKIIVSEENATATIEFENMCECELYLVWDNLSFVSKSPYSFYSSEKLDKMTKSEQRALKRAEDKWVEATGTMVQMKSENVLSTLSYKTWKDNYYCGHKDFIGNLGYSENNRNSITLTFMQTGEYSFDKLRVVSQPMMFVEQNVQKFTEECMENLKIMANKIEGNIQLDSEKLLCVQIPYNEGWRVFVDGEDKELLKVDEAFFGVMLPAGEHEIMFEYRTPYLMLSITMSIIGCMIYLIMVLMSKQKACR